MGIKYATHKAHRVERGGFNVERLVGCSSASQHGHVVQPFILRVADKSQTGCLNVECFAHLHLQRYDICPSILTFTSSKENLNAHYNIQGNDIRPVMQPLQSAYEKKYLVKLKTN